MYVIKFKDGTYNDRGWGVVLAQAHRYSSLEDAHIAAGDLDDVEEICDLSDIQQKTLSEAIEASIKELVVCVPSQDYYARAGDVERLTLRYIDPDALLAALKDTL